MPDVMPDQHAVLAPSAAKRWMTCTPSARLEVMIPKPDTAFTIEGTIAHAVAEGILRHLLASDLKQVPEFQDVWAAYLGQRTNAQLELKAQELKAEEQVLDFAEIFETVYEGYCRIIIEDYLEAKHDDHDAVLKVEQRLKLDEYIPEGFGSSDAVLIYDDVIRVYDLKYGKGVKVDADRNPQMMCYALGALCGPGELYDLLKVEMTIIQPRLHHVSTWGLTVEELVSWAVDELRPKAEMAFKGEGDFVPGEHCRFCAAAARCKALKASAEVTVKAGRLPDLMTDEELAVTLASVELVKNWVASVEDAALRHLLAGYKLPGYKLVEGKSIRRIGDQSAAIKALTDAGFRPEDYLKPSELKTIGDLEKLLRKQGFQELLGKYVIKPQGKATIAPESDPRPALGDAESDFSEINL